jgi:hypothetical protein
MAITVIPAPRQPDLGFDNLMQIFSLSRKITADREMQAEEIKHREALDAKLDPVRQAQTRHYDALSFYYNNIKPIQDEMDAKRAQTVEMTNKAKAMDATGDSLRLIDPVLSAQAKRDAASLYAQIAGYDPNQVSSKMALDQITAFSQKDNLMQEMEELKKMTGMLDDEGGAAFDAENVNKVFRMYQMTSGTIDGEGGKTAKPADLLFLDYLKQNPDYLNILRDVRVGDDPKRITANPLTWFNGGNQAPTLTEIILSGQSSFSDLVIKNSDIANELYKIAEKQGSSGELLKVALDKARGMKNLQNKIEEKIKSETAPLTLEQEKKKLLDAGIGR